MYKKRNDYNAIPGIAEMPGITRVFIIDTARSFPQIQNELFFYFFNVRNRG